jgi:hypothetical protein
MSIVIDPKELSCDSIHSKKINSEKAKEAESQLIELVAAKIGESIKIAISDGAVNLTKIWEKQQGITNPITRIKQTLSVVVPKEYKSLVDAISTIQDININNVRIRTDVQNHLVKTNKKFVLMIDDIDRAIEEKDQKFEYSTCWAIIEAAIDIANKIEDIAVIISVRTDIWHTMTKVKNMGSSIQDKIPSPYQLKNDEKTILGILNKRLETCSEHLAIKEKKTLNNFFVTEWISLPGRAEISRTWDHWIAKNSRNRPRDMVKLMQNLIESCLKRTKNNNSKIDLLDLKAIIVPYGSAVIDKIEKEYFQICPQLKNVFRYFEGKTRYDFAEITDLLGKCASDSITIDGVALHPGDKKDAIKILRVLHMASFINPRIEDSSSPDNYKHILFEDDPDFINPENFNPLQKVLFEVHPTFHEIVKQNAPMPRIH